MLLFKSLAWLQHIYFNEFSHSRDFHSYNTRHRDLLLLPLARTTKCQGSFRFSGAKIWLDLTSVHDINKFAFGLERHLDLSLIEPPQVFVILCVVCFFSSLPLSYQPR